MKASASATNGTQIPAQEFHLYDAVSTCFG
jgi:hypothetical protein